MLVVVGDWTNGQSYNQRPFLASIEISLSLSPSAIVRIPESLVRNFFHLPGTSGHVESTWIKL